LRPIQQKSTMEGFRRRRRKTNEVREVIKSV